MPVLSDFKLYTHFRVWRVRVRLPAGYQVQQVADEGRLDLHVDDGITVERGREVDLQEPGLEVGVDEDVEAVQLEAVPAMRHEHLARAVHRKLHRDDRLDDHVFDVLEDGSSLVSGPRLGKK